MRFVAGGDAAAKSHREDAAGRGAAAELMAGSAMAKRIAALWQRAIWKMLLAGALQQRAIGKMLPAGALQRRAVGKMLLARAPQWQRYCWQGRRGGAAGRGAVAEILLPGRTIGKKMLAGGAVAELLPAAAGRHYGTKKRE